MEEETILTTEEDRLEAPCSSREETTGGEASTRAGSRIVNRLSATAKVTALAAIAFCLVGITVNTCGGPIVRLSPSCSTIGLILWDGRPLQSVSFVLFSRVGCVIAAVMAFTVKRHPLPPLLYAIPAAFPLVGALLGTPYYGCPLPGAITPTTLVATNVFFLTVIIAFSIERLEWSDYISACACIPIVILLFLIIGSGPYGFDMATTYNGHGVDHYVAVALRDIMIYLTIIMSAGASKEARRCAVPHSTLTDEA